MTGRMITRIMALAMVVSVVLSILIVRGFVGASIAVANNYITSHQALKIALQDAEISRRDVFFPTIRRDIEDGTHIYEVDFESGGHEYYYDIDAASGEIIDVDIDTNYSSYMLNKDMIE